MSIREKTISAIIACYKEAETIPFMYERLVSVFNKTGFNYEIIFVNDGSPDNTEAVLEELANKDARVITISHSRNFGSQSAFMSGLRIATGDAAVLLDGDLQDPPELIPQFIEKWNEGYDVVYGIRVKRDATIFLRFAYKAFYRVFSRLSYIHIPLDAGDFSLLDRKVVAAITAMPERDLFIRGLRAWVGFKQTGIDYHRPERMFGRTTNNLTKNIRWAKKAIFSFSYEPLEFVFWASLILSAITCIAIIGYVILFFIEPNQPPGITTLIVLTLFFGSIQLISLSIIGEYLGRIFEEVKQRPQAIIKSIRNKGI